MKRFIYILVAAALLGPCLVSCEKEKYTDESHLIYFGLTQPYARVGGITFQIDQLNKEITNVDPIPANVDLTSLTPWFATNDGKGEVRVKGIAQTSGVSKQNLSSPVEYEVVSGGSTVKYTVKVTQSELVNTQVGVRLISASPLIVAEIKEEREVWLSDYARFTQLVFNTADGYAWRLNVVEASIDDSGLTLRPILPNNITAAPGEGAAWPSATVAETASSADGAGVKVLAAVSGDFTSGDAPEGGLIVGGSVWKTSFVSENVNHYFGIRKDGRASIGSGSDFMTMMEKLEYAIGGRQILMNGGTVNSALGSDSSRESRVAVAVNSADLKTAYLISIDALDGSAGCTCSELAELLADLGAGHGIILQGGDKTQFVVKEGGSFSTVSAAQPQNVVNSLALVIK